MIKLKNIRKTYKNKNRYVEALKEISLEFPEKGFIGIVGESGSGKTTLLNIISTLDEKYDGVYSFLDCDMSKHDKDSLSKFRSNAISVIYQDFKLLEDASGEDNINLYLPANITDEHSIYYIIECLGLNNIIKDKVKNLSGGQKQRVAIARGLSLKSKIVIADEPTSNLDSKSEFRTLELLKEISKSKLVILVIHNDSLALQYCDRIIQLENGKVVSDMGSERISSILVLDNVQDFEEEHIHFIKSSLAKNESVTIQLNKKLINYELEYNNMELPNTYLDSKKYDKYVISNNIFEILLLSTRIIVLTLILFLGNFLMFNKYEFLEKAIDLNSIDFLIYDVESKKEGTSVPDIFDAANLELININNVHTCIESDNTVPYDETNIITTDYRRPEKISCISFYSTQTILEGREPENIEEVVISDYLAYFMSSQSSKYDNLIGTTMEIEENEYIISGIFQTNWNEKYGNGILESEYEEFDEAKSFYYSSVLFSRNFTSLVIFEDWKLTSKNVFEGNNTVYIKSGDKLSHEEKNVIITYKEGVIVNQNLFYIMQNNDNDYYALNIQGHFHEYKVIGYFIPDNTEEKEVVYLSNGLYQDLVNEVFSFDSLTLLNASTVQSTDFEILEKEGYVLTSQIVEEYNSFVKLMVNSYEINKIVLISSVVLFLFLIVLSSLINVKGNNILIGLLSSKGIKSKKVISMFLFKSIRIEAIVVIVSLITNYYIISYIQETLQKNYNYSFEFIGSISLLKMFLILIAVISIRTLSSVSVSYIFTRKSLHKIYK